MIAAFMRVVYRTAARRAASHSARAPGVVGSKSDFRPCEQLADVGPQLVVRGPAPEPVADVDLLDDEAGGEDQRVRHAGVVVVRVRVLVDVEVLLHLEIGVGEERPARAGRDLELVHVVQDVGHDRDELGERDRAELVEAQQLAVVLALARAVLAAAEVQDEDVVALDL
jgi:hypothetical protein